MQAALLAMVMAAVGDAQPTADEVPIAILWNAPDGCPTADALRSEVRRIAGQVPAGSEHLSAEVSVQHRAGGGWQLTLATTAGTRAGERTLAGSDCAELMRAAALVLALMLNPDATFAVAPPPPAPRPPPPPAPAAEARFAVGADMEVGTGALPGGVAPGVGVRFGVASAAFAAEVRATLWMPRSTASPPDPAAGGTFKLIDAAAAGCGRAFRTRRVSPGLCLGASVVRLHASGYGVSNPGQASAWWPAAFVEANVRVRVTSRNALRLAGQALIPAGNPRFDLAGVGHVFEPASIWVRGSLGWELHF